MTNPNPQGKRAKENCAACHGTRYVQAPDDNAWKQYFQKRGGHYAGFNVLVPCPECEQRESTNA